jgi:hypothetical protein
MKNRWLLGIVLIVWVVLTSCASIVAGGPTAFSATSNPAGATVTLKGLSNGEVLTGETPATFTLNKGSDYEVSFELAGYKSESMVIRRTINGWFWGNIIIGGIPGWIVDAATQNMWEHTIKVANVEFKSLAEQNQKIEAVVLVTSIDVQGQEVYTRIPIVFYKANL